jgi:predicted molibdopterin-dependent oxidoreductase YjgC
MGAASMRIAGIARGARVKLCVDGRPIEAHAGENLATALWATGIRQLRTSPGGAPRGMFCGMGICQECVVEVEGVAVLACQTRVAEGLEVHLRRDDPA